MDHLTELKTNRPKLNSLLSTLLTTALAALLVCIVQLSALAQQTSSTTDKAKQTTAAADEEEEMDNALRKLGYISGTSISLGRDGRLGVTKRACRSDKEF